MALSIPRTEERAGSRASGAFRVQCEGAWVGRDSRGEKGCIEQATVEPGAVFAGVEPGAIAGGREGNLAILEMRKREASRRDNAHSHKGQCQGKSLSWEETTSPQSWMWH